MNKKYVFALVLIVVALSVAVYVETREVKPQGESVFKIQRMNYTHEEIQGELEMCFAAEDTAEVMQKRGYSQYYSEVVEWYVLNNQEVE